MKEACIVWSIAGSDPSGGAGIQADLKVFHGLGTYGCAALTSVIAQNTVGVRHVNVVVPGLLRQQLDALAADVPPRAVKIGLVPACESARVIADQFKDLEAPIVYDPVAVAGSGHALAAEDIRAALRRHLLPMTTVLTPNVLEAEALTGHKIRSPADMLRAAQALRDLGPRAVLLKGGHIASAFAADLWFDGQQSVWLSSPRIADVSFHGTGCTVSSAIAAGLAQGLSPLDAAVLAKAYVNQGMRRASPVGHGRRPLWHGGWPDFPEDLPALVGDPDSTRATAPFPDCGTAPLGFYLIVGRARDIERFAPAGVRTFQLRAKDLSGCALDREVAAAVSIARRSNIRLFINDAADLALKHQAYGVHLGQEDLLNSDVEALRRAGLRLGLSAYTWSDLARAAALRPSYIGLGAVFATGTKNVASPPLGIEGLARLVRMAAAPVVAIGGITLERARDVFNTGVSGLAVISDVHNAADPVQRARAWQNTWDALWRARETLSG